MLVVAVAGNFLLGALMTLGIGLYAPCMILVSLLGMSETTAFPIMMGSCAFLMPVGSLQFIRERAYSLRAALGLALGGIPGVLIAAYIVKSLPLVTVRWLVIVVVLYTAITMLYSAFTRAHDSSAALEAEAVDAAPVRRRPRVAAWVSSAVFSAQWTPQTSGVEASAARRQRRQRPPRSGRAAPTARFSTTDGGETWHEAAHSRDERSSTFATSTRSSETTAWVLSIGPGEASRIYKTIDAGAHWSEQFVNHDPKAFFDAMAFWDANTALP